MTALVRDTKKDDKTGEFKSRYIHTKPDHYAHSRVYCEAALPFALSMRGHGDITGLI